MQIVPAIDILGGVCARLTQGDFARAEAFAGDPAETARRFARAGATRLHLVDLDGAKNGRRENRAVVDSVIRAANDEKIKIQVGGGLRDLAAIESILDSGADYAMLGTAAIRDDAFRRAALAAFGERIVLCLDARDGMLAVAGWTSVSTVAAVDFAASLTARPPAAVVFTDIAVDGTQQGVSARATARIARVAPCPVFASGGVGALADFDSLREQNEPNLAGVIVGRALHSGAISLAAAMRHNRPQ